MNFKERRRLWMVQEVLPIRHTIKNWYLHAGMKFLLSKDLNDKEEEFLEEVTEFFLSNLDNLEYEKEEVYEEV